MTRVKVAVGLTAAWCLMALLLPLGGCGEKEKAAKPEAHAATQEAPVVAVADGAKVVVPRPARLPVKPAAAKPNGPLPPGTSCITSECHVRMANDSYLHGPVSEKACDACHAADTGTHHYPLTHAGNELCTRCHAVAGTMTHQHKALEQGCITCHNPHASQTKFLLKADSVDQLCGTCHSVPLKKYAHEPFAKGQCTLCHQPHQADNAKLLRAGQGSKQCFSCHEPLRQAMASAAVVHKPAQDDCITCHNPHASEHERELRAGVAETCLSKCHADVQKQQDSAAVGHGAMTDARSCVNCHNPHASGQAKLLAARADQVCLKCHDREVKTPGGQVVASMKPVLADSKFLHGPVRTGDCAACHSAHGGQHPSLLTQAFPRKFYAKFDLATYALCFGCHEKDLVLTETTDTLTGFRDGQRNLHYLHVNREEKGRTCRACHEVHGSNLPNHVASGVPFDGSGWAMAVRYEKTEQGGTCTPDCHAARPYRRSPTTQAMTQGAP